MGAWPIAVIRNAVWGHVLADKMIYIASEQGCCRSVHYSVQRTVLVVPIVCKQYSTIDNIVGILSMTQRPRFSGHSRTRFPAKLSTIAAVANNLTLGLY